VLEGKASSLGAQVLNLKKLLEKENEQLWSERNKLKEVVEQSEKYRLKTVE